MFGVENYNSGLCFCSLKVSNLLIKSKFDVAKKNIHKLLSYIYMLMMFHNDK